MQRAVLWFVYSPVSGTSAHSDQAANDSIEWICEAVVTSSSLQLATHHSNLIIMQQPVFQHSWKLRLGRKVHQSFVYGANQYLGSRQ